MTAFSALVLSLPTRDSTVRMRVWRALKATGCGVLRDGVYLLPPDATTLATFAEVESQVRAANGFAMRVGVEFAPAQLDHARKLFDRGEQYGQLLGRINETKPLLARLGKRKADTAVQRHERSFEELAAVDFFPGEAKAQARDALQVLRDEARRLDSRNEPHALRGRVKRADPSKYRGRVWATRKEPWIDRLASAWLIKRFIDKAARFAWIDSPRQCPKNAVGFDFDGAPFTHVGSRITFEVLIASFGLGGNAALASIASAVHFLDAGGIPVADARGLETVLRGVTLTARDDDEKVSKANGVFDQLYAAYSGDSRDS
jgi:hypothetical protein